MMKNKIIKKKKYQLDHIYNPMPIVKKGKKISNELFTIPNFDQFNNILNINYNKNQLKKILKFYKQRISGNKNVLIRRCYNFLKLSYYCVLIQKNIRRFFVKKYIYVAGPALKNYKLCTNETDFLTLDKLKTIKPVDFFSFEDEDAFIYGFEFSSIYNLLLKSPHPNNPYNRQPLPKNILKKIRMKLRLTKLLNIPLKIKIEDGQEFLLKNFNLRVLAAFQKMDELGNYTNQEWFISLTKFKLIRFIRELLDIWQYRAQLTNEMKRRIFPPRGNPFEKIKIGAIINKSDDIIKRNILKIIENLIDCGIDKHAKCLGAFYVLGALTLVNSDAASALPWLYDSMRHATPNVIV